MRWFYEFCSRIASMHRDNIKDEIEEHTRQLNHARHCARVCNEAERIGTKLNAWAEQNQSISYAHYNLSREEVKILQEFVWMKVQGLQVHWKDVYLEKHKWFVDQGLDFPKEDEGTKCS